MITLHSRLIPQYKYELFHIYFTCISLEQKELFENSKQHFSSHAGYLFMALIEKM